MPLYKVNMNFQVVVEAASMFEALDVGIESFRTNKGVPATGAGTLIDKHSQIPQYWRERRPANKAAGTPVCSAIVPPRKLKAKAK